METERAWQCNECGEVHGDEDDAYACCRPTIAEGWVCLECKAFHMTKSEALDCCYESISGAPRPPTHEELEAAGQQCLAL